MLPNPQEIYTDACAAFNRGDYAGAIELATKCLHASPFDSYWFPAALGLRCWAANFAGDHSRVEIDAHALLSLDTGDDKMWFDGLAVFNIALIRQRVGDVGEAESLFDQARAKYAAYQIDPQKADARGLARTLFEAVSHWAASGETDRLDDLAGKLSAASDPSGEIGHLRTAVGLYQRLARREDVTDEAQQAANEGVSRDFLALALIG